MDEVKELGSGTRKYVCFGDTHQNRENTYKGFLDYLALVVGFLLHNELYYLGVGALSEYVLCVDQQYPDTLQNYVHILLVFIVA